MDFSGTPRWGAPPLSVSFSTRASGDNTNIVAYAWDFNGDGAFDAAGPALHSPMRDYTNAGLFTVTLRVTNALGVAASRTHLEYVDTTIPESVCIALGAPLLLLRRRDR